MNKNIRNVFIASLLSATIISSAVFASPASALTVDELQSQIKELLSKVSTLQEQLKVALQSQGQGSGQSDIQVTAVPRICKIMPQYALALGTRGDEVRGLQEFLKSEGFLNADATGFFGSLTRDALSRWQVSQGIPGVGIAGPMTREKLFARCGRTDLLTVNPTSGKAPLQVTVTSKIGDANSYRPSAADGQDVLIDFGDGTERQWVHCDTIANDQFGGQTMGGTCINPVSFTHTYSANGTYTVKLLQAGGMCVGGCPERIIATSYVTVGDAPVACTKEYRPVCGAKQVVCIKAPCNPVPQTYGNRCMMQADGASYLYDGACTDNGSNKPPVVSSFGGPTKLSVNENGTWTIQASDPESGYLSYAITWGDEFIGPNWGSGSASAKNALDQTATFTHSYAKAGTYTVTVIVSDSAGAQSKTSATVQVGSEAVACTMEYVPVCGRPTGCMDTCPAGMYCTMMCRLHDPVTYGNRCMMNAAGAEFLYEGQCSATN